MITWQAGLMEGVIVMVFVSYFAIKAMLLIIDCKYKVRVILVLSKEIFEPVFVTGVECSVPI